MCTFDLSIKNFLICLKLGGLDITPSEQFKISDKNSPLLLLKLSPEAIKKLAYSVPKVIERRQHRDNWNAARHLGRIQYFLENCATDPIEIGISGVTGQPVILDGLHRFIVAVVNKKESIPAIYKGRHDMPAVNEILKNITIFDARVAIE